MPVDGIINAIRREAQALDHQMGHPQYGIVESYNPASATVRVTLQPDGVLTGWLPLACHWIGAGWGLVAPPSPGDQVVVIPQGGDPQDLIVVGRVYSSQGTPAVSPPAAPSGELWMVHATGAFVKMLNTGQITMQDAAGASVTLENTGTVTVNGNLAVSGNITTAAGTWGTGNMSINGAVNAIGDMVAGYGAKNVSALNHQHTNGNGGADTGAPIAGT